LHGVQRGAVKAVGRKRVAVICPGNEALRIRVGHGAAVKNQETGTGALAINTARPTNFSKAQDHVLGDPLQHGRLALRCEQIGCLRAVKLDHEVGVGRVLVEIDAPEDR